MIDVMDYCQYKYVTNGSFDYDKYVKSQSVANQRKLRRLWVHPETIALICDYLVQRISTPKFGLCHGTRRGLEQKLFRERFPDCNVVGTEIAPTATQFADTIQWDFHNIKPEWVNAADFVYTNSLDHAYDPHLAVDSWMQSLASPGYCFIEWWGVFNPRPVAVDCFSATTQCCEQLLNEWGEQSNYRIVDVLAGIVQRRRGVSNQDGAVFILNTKG